MQHPVSNWLNDTTLMVNIGAQLNASGNASISFKRIGLFRENCIVRSERSLTIIAGIKYD